ncbi:MAG TPA: hypothetical protein VJA21_28345 [Verrucomicrobiae bacterium]
MDDQTPNYRREFFKSPHHAILGFVTLGLGFLSAQFLGLIVGVTAYVLGWIYLPDLPLFRNWVDRRGTAARKAQEAAKIAEFVQRRDTLLRSLSPERRERYGRLTQVCRDIESAGTDSPLASADSSTDPRLKKLDELMWTYLRLLGIEESLKRFVETEEGDNLPALVTEAQAEATRLNAELEALKDKGDTGTFETRQRYLNSRLERLEVLRKRQQRAEQAKANLELVVSEQDRLDQQIKLLRADSVATKNAETLTARIDATVEHLDQTNKWLSELDEFKDLVGDMPATDVRVGYQANPWTPSQPQQPPVLPTSGVRKAAPLRQKQG